MGKRDRILSKVEGEKARKYFCNLEKERSNEKIMPELLTTDVQGNEYTLTDQNEIQAEIRRYYKDLYSLERPKIESIDDFLANINVPYLSDTEAESVDGEITMDEL